MGNRFPSQLFITVNQPIQYCCYVKGNTRVFLAWVSQMQCTCTYLLYHFVSNAGEIVNLNNYIQKINEENARKAYARKQWSYMYFCTRIIRYLYILYFVLLGVIVDNEMRMTKCNWMQMTHTLTRVQHLGLRKLYKKNCRCIVSFNLFSRLRSTMAYFCCLHAR